MFTNPVSSRSRIDKRSFTRSSSSSASRRLKELLTWTFTPENLSSRMRTPHLKMFAPKSQYSEWAIRSETRRLGILSAAFAPAVVVAIPVVCAKCSLARPCSSITRMRRCHTAGAVTAMAQRYTPSLFFCDAIRAPTLLPFRCLYRRRFGMRK